MSHTQSATATFGKDWLGFDCPFPQPQPRAVAGRDREPGDATITTLLNPFGEALGKEPTDIRIWRDDHALHVKARCVTAAMDRVRKLAQRKEPYARDAWGDDALELQLDVRHTQRDYLHIILPPNGLPLTYLGANNRHMQGWHPQFELRTWLEEGAWCVKAALSFDVLGGAPADDDVWGLNIMRVNANELRGYLQWAPTFGDALRPELFGELHFYGKPDEPTAHVEGYLQRAAQRKAFFLDTINAVREPDALRALGATDWAAWGEHMAGRTDLVSLRWEGVTPGVEGIPPSERPLILAEADALAARIATWSVDAPDQESFGIATFESLGDAWLLTGDRKYVTAFDHAMRVHAALMRKIMSGITDPHDLHHSTNPYHDIQVVNTAIVAHAYINLSRAGLSPDTHATMMWTVLRAGRYADYNIRGAYNYGNHQIYEAGGLGAVAALFPELPESDQWASTASRSIDLHLRGEVYPDGAYGERCGYHSVALSFAMHAVATARVNHVEHRFPELMSKRTQQTMERMYDWMLWLNAPDGTFPAFGDCGAASYLCFVQRGAAIYNRGDLAWPIERHTPELVPAGVTPREPAKLSVSLESHFTVMRDGWSTDSFYMAVDHGPLGGQHSHPDTLGFVAYAHGQPVALDSGIGTSYEDSRYLTWFRQTRAHNVVAIDDIETEKVAELKSWKPGDEMDVLATRSYGYQHALGVVHDRTIYFIKGLGWFIHDVLTAEDEKALDGRNIDWVLHTPFALEPQSSGRLRASINDTHLLVAVANDDAIGAPHLTQKPSAVPLRALQGMRLWDAGRRRGKELTRDITELSLRHKATTGAAREFAVLLLPFKGDTPPATLERINAGWALRTRDGQRFDFTL